MKIENTVSVVTGGASGLGEACVRAFAAAGGKSVILDLDESGAGPLPGKSVRPAGSVKPTSPMKPAFRPPWMWQWQRMAASMSLLTVRGSRHRSR